MLEELSSVEPIGFESTDRLLLFGLFDPLVSPISTHTYHPLGDLVLSLSPQHNEFSEYLRCNCTPGT